MNEINYLPTVCPSCGEPVEWGENDVHLVCVNPDCPAQALQRIVAFFTILKVDKMGEGVCTQLYNAGYDTIKKILEMSVADMKKLDGFATKKSETLYINIHKAITNVTLSKLQHASGCFKLLGSRKLALVENHSEQSTIEDLITVEGFAEKSAKEYQIGIHKFNEFIKELPITIDRTKKVMATGNKCVGMVVVFTGYREKDAEKLIMLNGGEIGSGVSKKTTHLVMKEKNSGSSKEKKAIDLGITIWDKTDLDTFIK